jgi:beta-galactosidase
MTRGYYVMPSDSVIICPERWDKPYYNPSYACSAYDNCRTPWGNTHEATMLNVKRNKFISGQFVWTGFDYIGEPTPYGWPARSSYFGIVDLAGFPKDVYYLYQSEWRNDINVLHLFPHWNWTSGSDVDLWAYYNNADEVELFVNGVSQGVRTKDDEHLHVSWRVPYQPGTVRAVSRKDGIVVAEQQINTADDAVAVRLTADRAEIAADGSDLAYFTVEIVDKNGNVCPFADNEVRFTVSGSGTNVGVDNGSPTSLERFKADHRKAFYGKALLIVQSTNNPGAITVTATSAGLSAATATIQATNREL